MTEWTLSSLHQKAYGQWAGNERGIPADPARCCEEVYDRFVKFHQCTRPRGHGPEKAFCKQHTPDAKAARAKAADEKFQKEMEKKRIGWDGPKFFAALCKIADGDNDPRQTALDAIKDYRK